VKGVKPNYSDPKRSEFKTKAAVVEYVRKSFADGAALIASKGDSGMNDQVLDPSNQFYRIDEEAWAIIEHSGEHYGSLSCITAWRDLSRRSRAQRSDQGERALGLQSAGRVSFAAAEVEWVQLQS